MDSAVSNVQTWLNKTYKGRLGYKPIEEDGITGWGTVKALIIVLQIEKGISVPNGIFGPSTKKLIPVLREGSAKTNFIKLLEYALYLNNYNPNNFSGEFTSDVKKAVIGFQKFTALDTDGIVGLSTWASLYIGRYLTSKYKLTNTEVQTIINNGFELFAIFEMGGYKNEYFTEKQGIEDAKSTMKAAEYLGISEDTIIYFAVDYDALE